jgi:hypothetical protein
MKKYKLIKAYPGSPKLGYIVEASNHSMFKNQAYYRGVRINSSNNQEFWEEIIEKPLFTTEDGVDVFEKQEVFELINNTKIFRITFLKCTSMTGKNSRKYFSTKEKAENYILMNKPCLSLNDVFNMGGKNNSIAFKKGLKDIVKSKL